MIAGEVRSSREATIQLQVRGIGVVEELDAAIDTGFNDFLALPPAWVSRLWLPWVTQTDVTVADGSRRSVNAFTGFVSWNGRLIEVLVLELGAGPLVGMALLYGSRLTIDVVDGGRVTIEALP
jgi:clan AA aspartic protease